MPPDRNPYGPPPEPEYFPPRPQYPLPPTPPALPGPPPGTPPALWDSRPVSGYPMSPGYPYAPAPQQVMVSPGPQPPMSMLAMFSMIMGIVGVVTSCCSLGIPSVLAVVLGHFALPATNRKERGGHGMAMAGLVMGYIMVAPAIVMTVWFGFALVTGAATDGVSPTPTP